MARTYQRAIKSIVVATDGSSSADRAIDAAAWLAKATCARLAIVTAGGNVTGTELRRLAAISGDLSQTMKASADKVLERARKRATRIGASPVKVQVGWGEPAETILDVAARNKADLIVIGRRGQGHLSRLLLGSVSQKVASLAPSMVLVVP